MNISLIQEPQQVQKQIKTIHQGNDFKIETYLDALEPGNDIIEGTKNWMYQQIKKSKKNLKILIIGQGSGRLEVPFLEKLRSNFRLHVCFMDYSEVSNNELEKVLKNNGWDPNTINYEIKWEDFETSDFKENKYDIIVAFFVINFFSDWISGLKKIFSLLEPNGYFFISEDTNDICFIDNTFDPLDNLLKENLCKNISNDRVNFYRFWQSYYSRREQYGYAWNPLISPSDMGLAIDIFKKLRELGYGYIVQQPFTWEHNKLMWNDWVDMITDFNVFNCLSVIPSSLRSKLANEMECWLQDNIIDLVSVPKLNFGHRISCYRLPDDLKKNNFDRVSGYIIESKYEKSLFKKLSYHEPFNLDTTLEETRLEDQIRRLVNTHKHLPLIENITLSLVSWKLEELGDAQMGDWSDQVPIMLPEQFNGNNAERVRYCTSYAIYMCLGKYREQYPNDEYFLVSEILILELPDNIMIHFEVGPKDSADIDYHRNGKIKSLKIVLAQNKVKDIRRKTEKICGEQTSIDCCSKSICGEKEHLFGYPSTSLHWLRHLLSVAEDLWNIKKPDITGLFDIVKKKSVGLEKTIANMLECVLIDKNEWIDVDLPKLAKSLAFIGYANAIVGAESNNQWKQAVFIPARTFLQPKKINAHEIPWDIGLLGFICYFTHKIDDKDENIATDWNMIQHLLGANANLFSLEDAIQQYAKLILKEALKSAITGIMARNMDHLLGSHIETGIAHQMPSFRKAVFELMVNKVSTDYDNKCFSDDFWFANPVVSFGRYRKSIDIRTYAAELEYSNYRLRRMDLIARFSTEWISWGVGMSFFYQVMLPFMKNLILLHFLGHGEKLDLKNIDIQVLYPVSGCEACFKRECTEHRVVILNTDPKGNSKGRLFYATAFDAKDCSIQGVPNDIMKIRGGDIGAHAFHIILENILRNSAKHKYKEGSNLILKIFAIERDIGVILKKMNIYLPKDRLNLINIKESEHWYVLVSSSTDCEESDDETKKLAQDIDDYLCGKIITPTGKTDPYVWGMKEKKICAAFLANKPSKDTNTNKPDYIGACTIEWSQDERHRLAYWLKIPKANYLLYVNDDPKEGEVNAC